MTDQNQQTANMIKQALLHWGADSVTVKDNSHLHVGHAGAKSGGGHFAVSVVAEQFSGLNRLKRHRLVHKQLTELWDNGRIHALEVDASTTEEIT